MFYISLTKQELQQLEVFVHYTVFTVDTNFKCSCYQMSQVPTDDVDTASPQFLKQTHRLRIAVCIGIFNS